MRAALALVLASLAAGCDRVASQSPAADGGAASMPSVPSTSAPVPTGAGSAAPVTVVGEGTDPNDPKLSPDDESFVDTRKGWGWGDRCFNEIKQGKWGWARAACDRGLALPDVDAKARPALLYNEGLIMKHAGKDEAARDDFMQSLALRPGDDPQRAEVEKQLRSVGGTPPPTPPVGNLECRAHAGGRTVELWLSWTQNTATGSLKTIVSGGASSQAVSAEMYKGLILVNPAGVTDPLKRIATMQTEGKRQLQVGDAAQPWAPCE